MGNVDGFRRVKEPTVLHVTAGLGGPDCIFSQAVGLTGEPVLGSDGENTRALALQEARWKLQGLPDKPGPTFTNTC